jgi:hypothetical protein
MPERIQGSGPFDPTRFYASVAAGEIDLRAFEQDLLNRFALDQFAYAEFSPGDRTLPGPGGVATRSPEIAYLASQDPRSVLARTQAAREVAAVAGGVDRGQLEAAIKELYQQLHAEGLPLEARPGSKLAEGLANGDLSQLSNAELIAVLISLAMYAQNKNNPGAVARNPNVPIAPRGTWGPNGNSHGGGTRRSGANGDADPARGPAPSGPAPNGTATGDRLAASANRVANRMGSVGYCYRGVKAAIRDATGVQLQGGSAYQAANQLSSSGRFREVSVSPSELRRLPPGAVVVWGQTDRSPHGHISVALGDGREASDHVQTQMTSLRGAQNYRVFLPA